MLSGPRVYVDFDDVLCETARCLVSLLDRQFGKRVCFDGIETFDLQSAFGLSHSEYKSFMEAVHRHDFLTAITPVRDVKAAVHEWSEAGLKVCVVTGRPPTCADASRLWLDRYAIEYSELMFVDKYGRHGQEEGGSLGLSDLVKQRFCFAVEDEPATAEYLLDHGDMPVLLLDRPWNRSLQPTETKDRFFRCRDWAQVMDWWRARS